LNRKKKFNVRRKTNHCSVLLLGNCNGRDYTIIRAIAIYGFSDLLVYHPVERGLFWGEKIVMNKKQLICMWCGIVAIVFFTLLFYPNLYRGDLQEWLQRIFLIALVTGGLIYTFKNKHGFQDEHQKPLNMRRGYRRITILLSIVTWLICSCFIFLIWNGERRLYNDDKKDYDGIISFWHVWDSNRWEAGNIGIIEYLLDNEDSYASFTINNETVFLKTYYVFPNIHKDMLTMH